VTDTKLLKLPQVVKREKKGYLMNGVEKAKEVKKAQIQLSAHDKKSVKSGSIKKP